MGKIIMSGIVPNLTVPVSGTPLSTYVEGNIIKINESGSPVEFYVAKHDYEVGLNGTGRTLVVRKDCFDKRAWNSNKNTYSSSAIDTWLNGDYKSLLSTKLVESVGTTIFQSTVGDGSATVQTLTRSVFLLSASELGLTAAWASVEGTTLGVANTLKIAHYSSNAVNQWLRTPYNNNATYAGYASSSGAINNAGCSDATIAYSRPCFTLPSTIKIDENGQVIE
jgi:hypothetical protein